MGLSRYLSHLAYQLTCKAENQRGNYLEEKLLGESFDDQSGDCGHSFS
jgi:hypothetical protein